ncbi:uncharacterized protein si:zfos-464b6.2 isoform X2 [Triplophysa rosa]|uniref:Glycosyltransferase family 92 protein n=1 Tax=Triplophysa rosa TaxID=992332 RepID=A0A9W7TUM2_TRIRA|nr:uncharacterized protein si:zfos-464b6.2 isoform X2 [Triplophysa rosa]KAI7802389.1 hypothetical protein IRJ41_008727 [Triplophysa rosa]
MFSKGKYEVKHEKLASESESNPSSVKRSCLPKIRPFTLCLVCVVIYISMVVVPKIQEENGKKLQNPKPIGPNHQNKPSDLPKPTTTKDGPNGSPPSKVCRIKVENGPLIKVNRHKTYVIGSYVEHRATKEIKSIAIMQRHEPVTYYCVMCCDGVNISTQAKYSIHSDHYNFDYGTADIMCKFSHTCSAPTHVAITANNLAESITSFQTIENRVIPKSLRLNFTVCISVMFDYNKVLDLIEAMEMFTLLGVQKVVIYKTSCDSATQKVLDYYVKSGFLELIPWTVEKHIKVSMGWQKEISPGELHYHGQIPALNDCVFRYMYQSRYVALQDIDELILPLNVRTWTELLPELEKMHGNDVGFEFENNVFPFTAETQNKYEQDAWKNVPGTNILKYVDRIPNDPYRFNNIKVIVNPRLVLEATVHGLLKTVNGHNTVRVRNDIARMYHLKNCEYPRGTHLIRDKRLWSYADDLIKAVSKVLQDCGFT